MRPLLLTALFLAPLLFSGCSEEPPPVVITSDAAPPPPDLPRPAGDGVGHIAGFVMDTSYRTMPGVRVVLPTFDLNDTTDRKGEFSFVDLPPGAYALEVNHSGYQPIRTVITVPADDFVRLHVILKPIPPADPWHESWEFEEVVWFTSDPLMGLIRYSARFEVEAQPGLHTMVVEAFMDDHGLGGTNGFRYSVDSPRCCVRYAEGEAPNQMRIEVPLRTVEKPQDAYHIVLSPYGTPPETDKAVEVFVTMFYNGPPPEDWSIAGPR